MQITASEIRSSTFFFSFFSFSFKPFSWDFGFRVLGFIHEWLAFSDIGYNRIGTPMNTGCRIKEKKFQAVIDGPSRHVSSLYPIIREFTTATTTKNHVAPGPRPISYILSDGLMAHTMPTHFGPILVSSSYAPHNPKDEINTQGK